MSSIFDVPDFERSYPELKGFPPAQSGFRLRSAFMLASASPRLGQLNDAFSALANLKDFGPANLHLMRLLSQRQTKDGRQIGIQMAGLEGASTKERRKER